MPPQNDPYYYRDLSFEAADETEIIFTVEFVSDGNSGKTNIDVPHLNGYIDYTIVNSGSKIIGKIKDLKAGRTIVVASLSNSVPQEDIIIVDFKVNGVLLQRHSNQKSETKYPTLILYIAFKTP